MRRGRGKTGFFGTSRMGGRGIADIYIGRRIRHRRLLLGMTQEALAIGVGLTIKEIEEYENGLARIAAADLVAFSSLLEVPVRHFFELAANTLIDIENGPDRGIALQ